MLLASIDYGTLELCTLAQTNLWWQSKSKMAEAINAGRDLHLQFAARMLGIDYEEAKARLKDKDLIVKDFRQLAKPINFGLPGGLGAAKLVTFARQSYGARFCELAHVAEKCSVKMEVDPRSGARVCAACWDVAKRLKREWLAEWDEMPTYFEIVTEIVEGSLAGALQIPGPEGDPGLIRGGCRFTEAANAPFQGLAARGAKRALYRVSRECYTDRSSVLWGTRPLVFVHDEILAEVPLERPVAAAHRMSEIMVASMRELVPDVAIRAEPVLMTRWIKGAEAGKNKDGTLDLRPITECPSCGGLVAADWDATVQAHTRTVQEDERIQEDWHPAVQDLLRLAKKGDKIACPGGPLRGADLVAMTRKVA